MPIIQLTCDSPDVSSNVPLLVTHKCVSGVFCPLLASPLHCPQVSLGHCIGVHECYLYYVLFCVYIEVLDRDIKFPRQGRVFVESASSWNLDRNLEFAQLLEFWTDYLGGSTP